MKRHTRTAAVLASVTLLAAAAAGCSDSGSSGQGSGGTDTGSLNSAQQADVPAAAASTSPSPSKPPATVSIRKGTYGRTLVNEKKMTLYVFDKDTRNKSMCDGDCAKAWPPLLDEKTPTGGTGVISKLLKTTPRSDGKKQVTYNGHPLYLFDQDKKVGDAKGQGVDAFGAKWYVINVKGKQVTTTATATATPTSSSSSGTGNGY
ncbi:COG4315 family predicted lipoprotein [Streptomyces sp. AC154]|uniref:COG4315 family predicted lipoprotein n=1 Tax=Streptomyces sp. AC154 TaxID=3143184 RepID=UPI003F7FD6BF